MHIDVSDILRQGEGAQAKFTIAGETPELEDLSLAAPLSGEVRMIVTEDGVLATGQLATEVTLECDRCLRTFAHALEFPFDAEFRLRPGEDEFPIDKRGTVDLTEPVRQEIELHLPITRLCKEDCRGIELNNK